MAEFRLPSLGADMDAATFVEWRIKPGDRVRRGDIVAAVETSKGIIDIEIFDSGVVEALLVQPGVKLAVGTVLAQIASDAPGTTPPQAAAPVSAAVAQAVAAQTPAGAPAAVAPAPQLRASPAARKHASERGIALDRVHGTGPHGVITIEDVERAAAAASAAAPPPAAPVAASAAPGTPPQQAAAAAATMRDTIAAAMTRAKREIPHYYLATAIDLHRAMQWLATHNREQPVTARLLAGVLLLRAVARALKDFPDFNGFWRNGRFEPGPGIHVGVAVSLRGGGLVAPALHDTDAGSLDALMPRFQDLVTRARSGHLRASEMADPTITVTSLGERGVDLVLPVIYPPQVAIVGFGRIAPRPAVTADGGIAVHPVVQATLAADHRVGDGHRGGLFLAAIERALQNPGEL